MCILIAITGCVLPSHVYFNISRADFEFDELSNEYSYDSDEFDSEEKAFRRICTSNEGSYIANRDNCNRFYVCEQEDERYVDPLVGMCPPGMWFDPNHSDSEVLCVFPEVLCATDHTAAYRYCNCTDMHPLAATQVNGIGGEELEDPMIETSPECIVDNQLHFYPSTADCGRYFICYNEKVFRMQCKPGFHFNVDMGYCDTAEEAGCKVWNDVLIQSEKRRYFLAENLG